MLQPLRAFHIFGDQFTELQSLSGPLPEAGYLWIGCSRSAFETALAEIQARLLAWTGAQLFELHISDLLNAHLPSTFDYTSAYDLLVFRRLAASAATGAATAAATATATAMATATATVDPAAPAAEARPSAMTMIDTSPVGFVVFDRVLLSVHPTDCQLREFFSERLKSQTSGAEGRATARMPTSPADLMLRMVNHMVDSYLELRKLLTKQLGALQEELFMPRGAAGAWRQLLDSRNALHLLEETCEDQRAAIVEWIDALDEWPEPEGDALRREHDQLRVRSRDVLEHIERVLSHVRRLEASSETAVQMHFSEQSNRTNNIMRTLTALTAIFLPLNLVTGFFGMNFEGLPLIHSPTGFWVAFVLMLVLGVGMVLFFWRKRYLGRRL